MKHVLAIALCAALTGCGATSTSAVVSAVEDTMSVLKTARSLICTTKLDPLLGNPREGQPAYVATPADASTTTDAAGD